MAYVITSPCVGTCDTACARACPVDCIHGPIPIEDIRAIPPSERPHRLARLQLFIDPDECICCGACQPVCPVDAIFEDDNVPPAERGAIEANAAFFRR